MFERRSWDRNLARRSADFSRLSYRRAGGSPALRKTHSFLVMPPDCTGKDTTLKTYADLAERQIAIAFVPIALFRNFGRSGLIE